jgi:tetratricopeptide (TPR) repeat protein
VPDEQAELNEAERLFRRVLQIDPAHVEARLHLGRVLGRMGRHELAARELREVARATVNPLTLYFARLFLGAEALALGDADEARDAYQGAAALYPHAQSPRLALSALAARAGDHVEALRLMGPALDPTITPGNPDPWWLYQTTQGRFTDLLLADLHAVVNASQQP